MPDDDLAITALLDELGFDSADAHRLALAALVEVKLTTGKKQRIAAAKRDAVAAVLAERFARTCARAGCREASAATGRAVVAVAAPTSCEFCGGSANQSSIDRAVAALRARGLQRLVVVGGSPSTREDLRATVAGRLELRLVSGTDRRTARDAGADLAWADLVVVWGATELAHRVSGLYTDGGHAHVVTCRVRGIAGLAETVLAHLARA